MFSRVLSVSNPWQRWSCSLAFSHGLVLHEGFLTHRTFPPRMLLFSALLFIAKIVID